MPGRPPNRSTLIPVTGVATPEQLTELTNDEMRAAAVVAFRRIVSHHGVLVGHIPDLRIRALIAEVRDDLDLAITAAIMDPRPDWVHTFLNTRRAL